MISPDRHRCGYVALVGAPNAGKSTLMNALMHERLAIVSPKPQTTRRRTLGIVSAAGYQMILLDTQVWVWWIHGQLTIPPGP